MLAMQDRGISSAGVVGINDKNEYMICKKAVSARGLIGTDVFKEFVKINPRIWIGHTRAPTTGDVTDENAHPFHKGRIIGAHNGHVSNYKMLDEAAKVDSEAIFTTLDKYENDYKKSMRELKGAFAITWIDLENPDKVFLGRGSNPLSIVKVPEIQTYFWASTFFAVQSVVGAVFNIENKTIWSPKENFVYEFSLDFKIKKTAIEFKPKDEYSRYYEEENYSSYIKDHESVSKSDTSACDLEKKTFQGNKFERGNSQTDLLPARTLTSKEIIEITNSETYELDFNDVERFEQMDMLTSRDLLEIQAGLDEGCRMCDSPFDLDNDMFLFWSPQERVVICRFCYQTLEDRAILPIEIDYLLTLIEDIEDYEEQFTKLQQEGFYK